MRDLILTPSEYLASIANPELTSHSVEYEADEKTVLLLAAGFEERAIGILKALVHQKKDLTVVIMRYMPLIPENRAEEIISFCKEHQVDVLDELTYDRRNPSNFGTTLVESIPTNSHLLIDISAMSRLLVVQIIVAVADSEFSSTVSIGYCEAEIYAPSQETAETLLENTSQNPMQRMTFLSSGVLQVAIVPELSSASYGSEQSRLIVFPSFDAHHLVAVRSEILPSRFTFVEGTPPSSSNEWRRKAIREINELDKFSKADFLEASTLDYRDTLKLLVEIYDSCSLRERVIISPTGSKMQSVAVGIFRAHLEDVQIVYPVAADFTSPKDYSKGIGQMHFLNLSKFFNEPSSNSFV